MRTLILYKSHVSVRLALPYADGGVQAGFPSPAQDYLSETIDLNHELIEHPSATFYARVVGDSMIEEGIAEGDLLVVDRALEPEHGDLAVCCLNGEFTLKRLRLLDGNRVMLMPSNRRYRPIEICEGDDFRVWGVVAYTIKSNRRRRTRLW
ncbi:MAG: translesion error-prone DNA polymerase V autoproteolytic subunit [Muribaculaceae bacterium]|nr:translesion error-prone DNA polymerase V autoproteolytic subunit [Muribaculaceae bacterium]